MFTVSTFSTLRLVVVPLVYILLSGVLLPAQALEVGEQFCIEGFVMDFFCINRGTLFDRSSVRTLENPELHSVHCLVDVGECVSSPYEILLDPFPGEKLYARGWRLDSATKDLIVGLARSVGSCRTCGDEGMLGQGFRAALNATVLDLGSSSVPPLISATEIQHTEMGNLVCVSGGTDANSTDPGNSIIRFPPIRITGSGTDLQKKYYAHASLMLIGWGFLLPTGTIFARFLKHRPGGLWFKIHQALQTIGLLFAIVGWNFSVFKDKGYNSYKHGILGMVTMCLGLLQPFNAILRPKYDPDSPKTTVRIVWEYFHKVTGYAALLLAVVTIGYGTVTLPDFDDQKTFQMAYGIGAGGILFLLFVILQCDRVSYKGETQGNDQVKEMDEEEQDSETQGINRVKEMDEEEQDSMLEETTH